MNRILLNSLFNKAKRDLMLKQNRGLFNYGMDRPFQLMKETQHAREGGIQMWRKICYFVAIPSVVLFSIYMYFVEQEHAKHPRPEFIEYEWMYNRKKNFPWGDGKHSLFHNKVTNALPGVGYEVPDPNEGHGHGEKH